jgi:alkyldihydroxyacetonephosphate synthase
VVWPESCEEIQEIVKLCVQFDTPLIPFGGGSGTCGGTVPVQGGVVLDSKKMNRILSIDRAACTVTTESGVIGEVLEQSLNATGFTLGHFPSNMSSGTVGGWLATRSAGQFSSRYGKIEHMVLDAHFVDGQGRLWDTAQQNSSRPGVKLLPLMLGSEGILGIFTQATFRIHPVISNKAYRGIELPNAGAGLELLQTLSHASVKPLALELYDPLNTYLSGLIGQHELKQDDAPPPGFSGLVRKLGKEIQERIKAPQEKLQNLLQSYLLDYPVWTNRLVRLSSESCLLIVGYEGSEDDVENAIKYAVSEAEGLDGHDLGATPALSFLEQRRQSAFKQPFVYKMGGCIDMLEVATNYENALPTYRKMMNALSELSVVMAHFAHTSRNGCSINFSFALRDKDPRKLEERYNRLWRTAMKVLSETGGVLSHHRGIGLARRDWIGDEIGAGVDVIRTIKRVLDPANILNPGTLIP